MAVEWMDQDQAKAIEELEETMIIEDEKSYFLTSLENMTKKINLLSLIKMMCGDENGTNSEFKFYSTSFIDNKVSTIYKTINDLASSFDEYHDLIEDLKTKIDISISTFEKIVNDIDPKLKDLEDRLQKVINERCNTLAQEHVVINSRIDTVIEEYKQADVEIYEYMKKQFEDLFKQIEEGGDISDQMFGVLQNAIDELRNQLNNIYSVLQARDTELENKINNLSRTVGNLSTTLTNMYYNKTQIDNMLTEIERVIKVQMISAETDSQGRPQDVNNYTADGLYLFAVSAKAANLPTGCVNGIVWSITNNGFVKQIFFRYGTINSNDYQMSIRSRIGSTWSTWAKVLTDKDITYGTGIPTALSTGKFYVQYFV